MQSGKELSVGLLSSKDHKELICLQITVKSDALIQSFAKDGLLFSNGSEIKADIVCFATG